MKFEQPTESNPDNRYEALGELSIEELETKVSELNLDQLTWLNAKLNLDLEKVRKDTENPELSDYEKMANSGTKEPILGELGLSLDELTLKTAQLSEKIKIVKEAKDKIAA